MLTQISASARHRSRGRVPSATCPRAGCGRSACPVVFLHADDVMAHLPQHTGYSCPVLNKIGIGLRYVDLHARPPITTIISLGAELLGSETPERVVAIEEVARLRG